jgi:hypothetical protein
LRAFRSATGEQVFEADAALKAEFPTFQHGRHGVGEISLRLVYIGVTENIAFLCFRLHFLLGVALMASTASVSASADPSSGARGMPGAKGTFEYKPTDWIEGATTWWTDSDGVDPGKAGCHIGTDDEGKPNGCMFGECCPSTARHSASENSPVPL